MKSGRMMKLLVDVDDEREGTTVKTLVPQRVWCDGIDGNFFRINKVEYIIQLRNDANISVIDDMRKCQIFNEYFLNIAKILKANIIQ